jgi:hypothetical protein
MMQGRAQLKWRELGWARIAAAMALYLALIPWR